MKSGKVYRQWIGMLGIFVLLLGLFGCGGSGSSTPAPAAPTGVTVTPGNGQATLSWTASTGATTYNVYYGTASGVTTTTGTKVTGATSGQAVTGLTNGTTYHFVVTAVNAGGESPVSSEVSTTPVAPPAKPSGIIASGGDSQVTISWTASTGATSYNLYYATTAGVTTAATTKVVGATSPQVVTGLTNGTPYYFVVTALNAGGESGVSSEKSATPSAAPQAPGTPNGVTPTSPSVGQVQITWNAVTGATSYNVYYLASSSTPTNVQVLAGTVVPSPTNSLNLSLTSGTKYWFLVTALNGSLESGTQTTPRPNSGLVVQ